MSNKVTATPAALELLAEIVADHGPVLFHQSGGCCDGSSPMCYPQGEFVIGDNDVKLGDIGGAPFYISRSQYEVWKHTDLIIDVVPGRGGMFSLDNGRERRFLTRSEITPLGAGEADSMPKKLILAAVLIAASFVPGMAQDAQKGKTVFNVCLACHTIGPGAQNKIGPELNGLDGRKAGTVPNFDYSDANKSSGIVWNEATFKEYIKAPAAKIPDTKMIFPGLKNEQQVNDVWAYISQFDADGNVKK